MRRSSLRICGLFLLPAMALAQSEASPGTAPVPGGKSAFERGLVDENGRPTSSEAERQLTAEQEQLMAEIRKSAPVIVPGALRGDALFTPTVHLRPRRLAPDERGVLHVVVTLQDNHVVVPGTKATLVLEPRDAALGFGIPELMPPQVGRTSSSFVGQPIYEDVLRFEVPLTIGSGARHGDHAVQGSVELALHDGQTGKPLGVFVVELRGSVQVGPSLNPAATKSRIPTGDRSRRTTDDPEPVADAPHAGDAAASGAASTDADESSGPRAGTGDAGSEAERETASTGDSRSLFWFLGLGVAAMVTLLLLRRDHS